MKAETQLYLERIGYRGTVSANIATLMNLHEAHLFKVPFENLDIHLRRRFDLKPENIFDKVVIRKRGGFCYELNLCFQSLLRDLGFDTRILAARVYDSEGKGGPEYDHMCLLVKLNRDFLADVGFGDFFIRPIELSEETQYDGRNYFRIVPTDPGNYDVLMSPDGADFKRKFNFSLREVAPSDFDAECEDKQINPESHFVRNLICTRPTAGGRVTVYNNKFIEHLNGVRHETEFLPDALASILQDRFDIHPF